jgi:hypothetical protein
MNNMALQPMSGAASSPALRSLAMVECGSAWTHASLFGMAEGHCRLLARADAPTTIGADLMTGVWRVLTALERNAGHRLLDGTSLISPENELGQGIDGLGMIFSAGGPLRVLLLGQGLDLWGPGMRRALATLAAAPSLDRDMAAGDFPLFHFDQTASSLPPHVILVLGPGAAALEAPAARQAFAATIERAAALTASRDGDMPGPALVVMGEAADQALARQALPGRDYATIEPQSPAHPGNLAPVLARIYQERVLDGLPGVGRMRQLASTPLLSSTSAMGRAIRFIAQRYAMNVLGVDVGATSTLALQATAQGNLSTTLLPLAGVRLGAGAVLRASGIDAIAGWLPFPLAEDDLRCAVAQRMVNQHTLPISPDELALDHALAREALRLAMTRGDSTGALIDPLQINVIVGTGGVLANAPHLGQAALVLLDAIQPRGMTSLVLDATQIVTALGGASQLDPTAAADAVDMDALLVQLGVCVSASGTPPQGEPALRVVLEYADGHRHTAEIPHGAIERLPLGVGQPARLMLYPAPGVDVGKGLGERAQTDAPIEGGQLGVIIDARGRPLVLPHDPTQRHAFLRQWQTALGA